MTHKKNGREQRTVNTKIIEGRPSAAIYDDGAFCHTLTCTCLEFENNKMSRFVIKRQNIFFALFKDFSNILCASLCLYQYTRKMFGYCLIPGTSPSKLLLLQNKNFQCDVLLNPKSGASLKMDRGRATPRRRGAERTKTKTKQKSKKIRLFQKGKKK